jgi:hypothetical protein
MYLLFISFLVFQMAYSSSLPGAEPADFLFLVILLAGKWSLAYSGLGALDVLSKPLTHTNPLQKQCCISSVVKPAIETWDQLYSFVA